MKREDRRRIKDTKVVRGAEISSAIGDEKMLEAGKTERARRAEYLEVECKEVRGEEM